jgi:hypothetical protein
MRNDVKRDDELGLAGFLYLGAHVLACGLGFFFGHYLFDKPIFRERFADLLVLPLLYVVLFFANALLVLVLEYVFKFFKKRNLFNPLKVELFLTCVFISSGFICFLPFSVFLAFWLGF